MAELWKSGDVTLRVDPQVLFAKAAEGAKALAEMRRSFEEMQRLASASASYWKGEAGEQHRSSCARCQETAREVFARLQEHVDELRPMGEAYEEAERAAQAEAETLSSDVII